MQKKLAYFKKKAVILSQKCSNSKLLMLVYSTKMRNMSIIVF